MVDVDMNLAYDPAMNVLFSYIRSSHRGNSVNEEFRNDVDVQRAIGKVRAMLSGEGREPAFRKRLEKEKNDIGAKMQNTASFHYSAPKKVALERLKLVQAGCFSQEYNQLLLTGTGQDNVNTQKKKASALSFLWLGKIEMSKAMAILLVAAIPTVSTIVIAGGVAWRNHHGGDPNPNKAPVVSRYDIGRLFRFGSGMNSITRQGE